MPSPHRCGVQFHSAGQITCFPSSPPLGLSLSSAAFVSTFDLRMVPKLFSALSLEEDEASCVVADEDGGLEG